MRNKNLNTPSYKKAAKVDVMVQVNPNHDAAHKEAEAWLKQHPKAPLPIGVVDGYQSLSDRGYSHFAARFLRAPL